MSETFDPDATPEPPVHPPLSDSTEPIRPAADAPYPANPAGPVPPPPDHPDVWVVATPGEEPRGFGASDVPTGPWATSGPPQPWDGGGHWTPGQWGGPPIWLPPHQPTRNRPLHIIAIAALVAIVALLGVAVGRKTIQNQLGSSSPPTTLPSSGASETGTVALKVDPGVVDITTRLGFSGGEAAGTGMVLNTFGDVLTNNHVIDGATSITVTDVGNGETYTGEVVGTDKTQDIAVLKLSGATGLKTVTIGNSSNLAVGNPVTAVGNAGGVGGTPSAANGHVTNLDQAITASDQSDNSTEQLTGLIQTDASLRPGDSGGPLVNSGGVVMGIDTAASSGFQFQAGTEGFAIPISQAMSIARQILAGQGSDTVHIGAAALIGVLVDNAPLNAGARVVTVETGTPADNAGLVPGDVVISLAGQSVTSATSLTNLMERHHPGQTVKLGWIDTSGQQQSTTVQLAPGPAT